MNNKYDNNNNNNNNNNKYNNTKSYDLETSYGIWQELAMLHGQVGVLALVGNLPRKVKTPNKKPKRVV